MLSQDFERVNIRVVESNSAFVEVISTAEVSRSTLIDLAFESESWRRRFTLSELEKDLEKVRSWIPGNEQGTETTFYWTDVYPTPTSLKGSSPKLADLRRTFQDGSEYRLLEDFRVSVTRGLVTLADDQAMFLGTPDKMFNRSLVINLGGSLSRSGLRFLAPGYLSIRLPDEFASLSKLYGIHFWCKARGKEIEEIEQKTIDESDKLPANTSLDPEHMLNEDGRIFDVQADWTKIHARISKEKAELLDEVRSIDIDHQDTGLGSDDDSGLLNTYIDRLEDEVEQVAADDERVNEIFNSLSEYTSNQLDVVAYQQRQQASEQSRDLQRKVYQFTILVAILTVVLTVDAMMSGGLSALIDNMFSEGIAGVSNQIWKTLGAVVLGGLIALRVTLEKEKGWWKPSWLD